MRSNRNWNIKSFIENKHNSPKVTDFVSVICLFYEITSGSECVCIKKAFGWEFWGFSRWRKFCPNYHKSDDSFRFERTRIKKRSQGSLGGAIHELFPTKWRNMLINTQHTKIIKQPTISEAFLLSFTVVLK